MTSFASTSLIENIQRFDGFKLLFLMHVVFHHDFLKVGRGHVN